MITTIILKQLENSQFSFSQFYLRRAKRLLPALYCTLAFTTLGSLLLLTTLQWQEYLNQLISALTFTENMLLPSQTGYFESTSEGKPLLHIWSLSLEEQYYFVLPISLYFLSKKYRLYGLSLLLIVSLCWCMAWVYSNNQAAPLLWRIAEATKSEWAFYLLFTRGWELLAGSICAWFMLYKPGLDVPVLIKFMSLICIFVVCSFSINSEHPSIESIVVVLATTTILIGQKNWLPSHALIHLLEKVGDWSYSVYLVHWPLFAFAFLAYVGDVPIHVKIALLIASFLLGYLQYRYVELPFRVGKLSNIFATWKAIIASTLLFLTMPILSVYGTKNTSDPFSDIRRVNQGLGKGCDGSFDNKSVLKPDCMADDAPDVVVWGDSYAMHLIPGLLIRNPNLAQLTKSACGPLIGLAPIIGKYDSVSAKSCLRFNENAFDYIKSTPSITHVVLSSNLSIYLDLSKGDYLSHEGIVEANRETLIKAFTDTIVKLQALGLKTIVVSPPPIAGFDIGECLERKYGPALLLRDSCNIKYSTYQVYQKRVNDTLTEIEKVSKVVWLKDILCKGKTCMTEMEKTFIYRDSGHLSIDGSVQILKQVDIKS